MVEKTKKQENKWPSVEIAYEFVKPSYDWMQNRLDAVNTRIEFFLTLSSSVTVAAPIFAKALYTDIEFGAWSFKVAMAVFGLIIATGVWGRIYSGLKLVSPERLYDKWLKWTEWEFKKNAIYWAGKHFKHNASLVNRKANFAIAMGILFALEVVFMVLWIGGVA